MKLNEIKQPTISYIIPNFAHEYEEALRYPFLRRLSKQEWIALAQQGKSIQLTSNMLSHIDNTEAVSVNDAKRDFSLLDRHKRRRFDAALNRGVIEQPIIIKRYNQFELLGGNTRLTGLVAKNIMPVAWLIDLDTLTIKK